MISILSFMKSNLIISSFDYDFNIKSQLPVDWKSDLLTGVLFASAKRKLGTINSSKCSIAILLISLNSCNKSCVRGGLDDF